MDFSDRLLRLKDEQKRPTFLDRLLLRAKEQGVA